MRVGVVTFPGSTCDRDVAAVLGRLTGCQVVPLWHADRTLAGAEAVVLPGGFSYGDYLRPGAMARFAPVMEEVVRHAERGAPVLGICNGFQVLTEAGLLPGALLPNAGGRFICAPARLVVQSTHSPFTRRFQPGQRVDFPIAHAEGRYHASAQTLAALEGEGRVAFRYLDNPNGSANDVAGILNAGGNVLGLMPHPERAADALLGSTDGLALFESLLG